MANISAVFWPIAGYQRQQSGKTTRLPLQNVSGDTSRLTVAMGFPCDLLARLMNAAGKDRLRAFSAPANSQFEKTASLERRIIIDLGLLDGTRKAGHVKPMRRTFALAAKMALVGGKTYGATVIASGQSRSTSVRPCELTPS